MSTNLTASIAAVLRDPTKFEAAAKSYPYPHQLKELELARKLGERSQR